MGGQASTSRTAAMVAATLVALTVAALGSAATRPQAPPIGGVTLEGKRLALSQFRGRPVLINVWSSW